MGSCCGNNHSKDQNKNGKAVGPKDKVTFASDRKPTEGQKPAGREISNNLSLKQKIQGFFGAKSS